MSPLLTSARLPGRSLFTFGLLALLAGSGALAGCWPTETADTAKVDLDGDGNPDGDGSADGADDGASGSGSGSSTDGSGSGGADGSGSDGADGADGSGGDGADGADGTDGSGSDGSAGSGSDGSGGSTSGSSGGGTSGTTAGSGGTSGSGSGSTSSGTRTSGNRGVSGSGSSGSGSTSSGTRTSGNRGVSGSTSGSGGSGSTSSGTRTSGNRGTGGSGSASTSSGGSASGTSGLTSSGGSGSSGTRTSGNRGTGGSGSGSSGSGGSDSGSGGSGTDAMASTGGGSGSSDADNDGISMGMDMPAVDNWDAAPGVRRFSGDDWQSLREERVLTVMNEPGPGTDPSCYPRDVMPMAEKGKLTKDQVSCVQASLSQAEYDADKARLSLVLITNAHARMETDNWEWLVARHLETIDPENPGLAYRYALHLYEKGPEKYTDAYRWAGVALGQRAAWTGSVYHERVTRLYKLRSALSQAKWKSMEETFAADPSEDNRDSVLEWRENTRKAALEWYRYAQETEMDTTVAYKLCTIASIQDGCEGVDAPG